MKADREELTSLEAGDAYLPIKALAVYSGLSVRTLRGYPLTVNRNYVRGVLTTPKNHQRRRVDMSTQLVGHSSIQVTVDVYGHLVPGGNRAAVDRLDDVHPSTTPAQPGEKIAVGERALSALERVVSLTFASWNRIAVWLRQVDALRPGA
jgi:hypothetical protein